MSLFLKATRAKLRFASGKGLSTVEDLWDLPMTKLRGMANVINRGLKSSDDLFATRETGQVVEELRLAILMEVIEVRNLDKEKAVTAAETSSKRETLRALIATKRAEAQGAKSIEELEKELAGL